MRNQKKFKKLLRFVIVVLITADLLVSSYYIGKWFFAMVNSYCTYYNFPKEDRIFTTAYSEYLCSLSIRKDLPEDANILWIPQVSHFVNYYIYPRKIYQIRQFLPDETIEIDRDFLTSRNIQYIFFDYDKLYPIKDVEILYSNSKAIIIRK